MLKEKDVPEGGFKVPIEEEALFEALQKYINTETPYRVKL